MSYDNSATTKTNLTDANGVRVRGNFSSTAVATLVAKSNFKVQGSGASLASGNVQIDGTDQAVTLSWMGTGTFELDGNLTYTNIGANAGTLNLTNTGVFTVDAGSLALTAANSILDLDATSSLVVTGGFTNGFAARTNMTFDGASTVTYNNAAPQTMVSTVATNKYGILITTGGEKLVDVNVGNEVVYVSASLAVNGNSYINLGATSGSTATPMNGKIVDVAAGLNNLTYAGDLSTNYITGQVRRSGALNTTDDYTFNNASTKLNFATVPTDFTVFVVPGALPSGYGSDVLAAFDIGRTIVYGYTGTAPEVDDVLNGYLNSETAGVTGYDINYVKYAEAFSSASPKEKWYAGSLARSLTGGVVEINSTYSAPITKSIFENSHTSTNTEVFANNSALVLTTKSAVYSIADGRWSNPATWDDNIMPSPNDEVYVRHFVYTGVDGAAYGSNYAPNERMCLPADANDDSKAAAYRINIIASDATYTHPALVIGHKDSDLPPTQVFRTRLTAGGSFTDPGIFNYNASLTTGDASSTAYVPSSDAVHGIYVTNIASSTGTAVLGASQITNSGTIVNCNEIQVGK